MTLARQGTRGGAAVAAMAKEYLKSDHGSFASGEEVKEEDETLYSENRERDIVEWIGRPHKPPSRNEDEEAESK